MKEERFLYIRMALCGWRLWEAEGESFRASEESAATGVWRAKRRDSHTEDQCQRALTSLKGLSAHPGGCELRLGLRRSDPRDRTGVGFVNTA